MKKYLSLFVSVLFLLACHGVFASDGDPVLIPGSTEITTLGTVTTGTWQGTAIDDAYLTSATTWDAKQDSLGTGITLTTTIGTPGSDSNIPSEKATRTALDLRENQLTFAYPLQRTANEISVYGSVTPAEIDYFEYSSTALAQAAYATAIDSYTVLLIHADEADGTAGTSIIDSETTPKTITAVGNAQVDTAKQKFGVGSVLFDGTGDYLTLVDSADWYMAADPFTISGWLLYRPVSGYGGICGQWVDANNYWGLWIYRDNITGLDTFYFKIVSGGVVKAGYNNSSSLSLSKINYTHVEIDRSGTSVYLFINGVSVTLTATTAIGANEIPDLAAVLTVGASGATSATQYVMNGWIDEFQISKGVARHTANFTPPAIAHPTTSVASESSIKVQGTYSMQGTAAKGTIGETLTNTVSLDLTSIDTAYFDIRSSRSGANLRFSIHDSGGTTTVLTPTLTGTNVWQTVTWDLSGVATANKDDIDSFIITVVNSDADNTFYLDNFFYVTTGSVYQDYSAALTSIAALTETNGGIPYGTADNTYAWLAAGGAGKLLMGAGAAAPAWTTPTFPNEATTTGAYLRADGTNFIQSTLVLPNSGTIYKLPVYSAANTITELAAVGQTGQYLRGATGAIPLWSTLTLPNTATAFTLPVYSATSVMTELAAVGGTGTVLQGVTGAIPAWSTSTYADTYAKGTVLHAGTANIITGLAPGAVGSFLMSNGTGQALSYLAPGAANYQLVGAGVTTIPVWTASTGTGSPVMSASPTFTGTVILPKTLEIQDTSADHQYVLAVSELTADRNVELPLLGAADTFMFLTHHKAAYTDINTGTEDNKYVTPDGLTASYIGKKVVEITVIDYATLLTTGNGKAYFVVPTELNGMNLVRVSATAITAGTNTGSTTIAIYNLTDTHEMLSTLMAIEQGETTTRTSATPGTIDTGEDDVVTGDILRIDIDAVTTATAPKGLIVEMVFQLP